MKRIIDSVESHLQKVSAMREPSSRAELLNELRDELLAEAPVSTIDSYRIFHGRGHCYPGLESINVDWFDPVILITLYRELPEPQWQILLTGLSALKASIPCLLVQRRYIRGGPMETLWGVVPEQALVTESGLSFKLSLGDKQNIGFFMDMEPGRRWLAERAQNKRVLNLFSYTCSFSVAAIAAGAHSVVNVDMSSAALNIGRDNHRLNHQAEYLRRDVQFLAHNLFRSWKKVLQKGPYDIVVIDPPSRQKGSFLADEDYARVVRRLPDMLAQGGDVLACLNAPELGENFLIECFAEHCPQARLIERLPNRDDFPERDPERNLKMLYYQL